MLALLLATTIGIATTAPPPGRYFYVEIVGGKKTNVSAVLVAHSGSKIVLNEDVKPRDDSPDAAWVDSRSTFDSSTLNLARYQSTVTVGCSQLDYSVSVDGSQVRIGSKQVSLPGSSHYVVDGTQALPFLLPAQMQAWHGVNAVVVMPQKATGYVVTRDPATETPQRPASIPAGDRYLAIRSPGRDALSLWYDPTTLVVDQFSSGNGSWLRVSAL